MKFERIRTLSLALPEVTEEPHFDYTSFRVRGKIFLTAPPGERHAHLFVGEEERELALALHPEFVEKLMWGARASGLRIELAKAKPAVVERLIRKAWEHKAPKRLLVASQVATSD
jgi:hypothetical protein